MNKTEIWRPEYKMGKDRQSVAKRGGDSKWGGNNYDGRVNAPAKEFTDVIVEVKPNQGITTAWVQKQIKELIILGTVRNLKQVSPNSVQLTVKTEFMQLVKLAIGKEFEVMKFYEKE